MYRNVEIILYDYDLLMKKVRICIDNKFNYAYICHDKDIDDNGDLKKLHYHLRIFNTNKKTISAWAKCLLVNENDIQILSDKRLSIRYLIHLDSKNKYQYNFEDIVSNFDISNYFLDKKIETDDIIVLVNYIDSHYYISMKSLCQFVIDNDLWATYRRNYSIIKELVYEHNSKI